MGRRQKRETEKRERREEEGERDIIREGRDQPKHL